MEAKLCFPKELQGVRKYSGSGMRCTNRGTTSVSAWIPSLAEAKGEAGERDGKSFI